MFEKSGNTKPVGQAQDDGDWLGAFNLWVLQTSPVPAFVLQQRHPDAWWAPEKLDLAAGGYYSAGEGIEGGLREAKEELGKEYELAAITLLGKRMNVGLDRHDRRIHTIIDVGLIVDDAPLSSYQLQAEEVHAIVTCPLTDLKKIMTDPTYSVELSGLRQTGEPVTIVGNQAAFPYNWDNYYLKMSILAERYLAGETELYY
jgi:hypothetical protein